MSYLGRLGAEMKCLSALFYFAILGSDSFVLPQMIAPRFRHEGFDVSFGVCGVATQVPTDCAVALTYPLHLFHCLQKLVSGFWIDSIFHNSDRRSLVWLGIDHYNWFGPMQRRRKRQIRVASKTIPPRGCGSNEQTNCREQ